MTQTDRRNYTKRCLALLGYNCVTPDDKDFRIYVGTNPVLPESIDANFNDRFIKDWDWIMEVVESVEKLYKQPNKEISFNIQPGEIEVFQRPYRLDSNDYHDVIYLGDGYINNSKKEAVVQAINQFLIWYNENN